VQNLHDAAQTAAYEQGFADGYNQARIEAQKPKARKQDEEPTPEEQRRDSQKTAADGLMAYLSQDRPKPVRLEENKPLPYAVVAKSLLEALAAK
jgi:hypothetical protein